MTDKKGNNALKAAVLAESNDIFELLLNFAEGCKIEASPEKLPSGSNSPAVQASKPQKSNLTQEEKDRLNAELCNAVENGNIDQLDSLVQRGANINCKNELGYSPFKTCAVYAEGSKDENFYLMLKKLKALGADVNGRDDNGQTALMNANDEKLIIILKELGV